MYFYISTLNVNPVFMSFVSILMFGLLMHFFLCDLVFVTCNNFTAASGWSICILCFNVSVEYSFYLRMKCVKFAAASFHIFEYKDTNKF